MQASGLTIFLLALFLPALSPAQEIYRATRSLEEQQAISHISQAEYYARMALRSLEASEKIGKAPYFNYQTAREDIEKILTEFKTYLKGEQSVELPPAVPLIIDGRYFAESIREFLATQRHVEQATSRIRGKPDDEQARLGASKTEIKGTAREKKKKSADGEKKKLQESPATILPPPSFTPQSGTTKRDRIEEILKNGL